MAIFYYYGDPKPKFLRKSDQPATIAARGKGTRGELLPKEKGGRGKLLHASNSLEVTARHRFRQLAALKPAEL